MYVVFLRIAAHESPRTTKLYDSDERWDHTRWSGADCDLKYTAGLCPGGRWDLARRLSPRCVARGARFVPLATVSEHQSVPVTCRTAVRRRDRIPVSLHLFFYPVRIGLIADAHGGWFEIYNWFGLLLFI